ncbi:zinc finger protein ZFP2-like [Ochlerotatus camptorhynchus]|uniref:zinc finger protein ZFP2-like n=1 Tax=Ochlerotatus camptorhynchus TaxID=644619 RepID=UPI0031E0AAF8
MDHSERNIFQVKQEPPENDDATPLQNYQPTFPANVRLLDQFCRLCLRQRPDLLPLLSRIQDISVPEMFRVITGLEVTLEDTFPLKTCRTCMTMLDYAFGIRRNFTESYRILKTFALSKTRPLIDNLSNYQNGARATSETLAEKMLRGCRDLADRRMSVEPDKTVPKLLPCVSIPLPKETAKPPVQIKQEPELILEPEELPHPAVTVTEAIMDNVESPMKKSVKKRKIAVTSNSEKRQKNRYDFKTKRSKLDPNKCYICDQVCEDAKDLQVHLPLHVDMIPYQCGECTKENGQLLKVTSLILLHKHFRMHASAIKCPKCPYRMCTMAALYGHMQIYHGQNTQTEYTCELCGVKLVNKTTLDRHMRFHKALDEGRYTCSYCDRKFATKPHLTRHERCHTNERPYQCKFCTKSYKTQSVMIRHERTHTGEKGFHCDVCDKSYRLRTSLNKHFSKIHTKSKEADGPVLTCDLEGCDFSTTKKVKYYQHKAKHELKFQCSQCSQRFPNGQRLKVHQYVHTGIKNFHCEQCDKSFRSKLSLDEHVAGHNNERPYSCETCGMTFVRERTLKQHRLKHSTQLSFECRHCGMKFRYRADQSRHERTHMEAAMKLIDSKTDIRGEAVTVKEETID